MAVMELNADVGEGGADALLMPHVNRVSIACGGHAGNPASMMAALRLARRHRVKAGSHPGYPDPGNFGRQPMPATPEQIRAWVVEQTRVLQSVAAEAGVPLFHVKPHGALYNAAAHDPAVGLAVVEAALQLGLALVVLAGSPLAAWARAAGVEVLEEAFADRGYLQSGALAPRAWPGAVLRSPGEAAAQAQSIARGQALRCLDGGEIVIRADTLCLHGEGPVAAAMAAAVKLALCST